MKGLLAAVAVLALLSPLPLPPSQAQGATAGPPVTVLVYHPDDGVDPLGFSVGAEGLDPFSATYAPLVADKGRFDFPFFVADGVLPIEQIPDPSRPFASALSAYSAAVDARSGEQPAAVLVLSSLAAEGQALVQVNVQPQAQLDLAGEDLHLRIAVVEDHVEYQPPPGLTNGITDHRFTVRAFADLGRVDGRGNWTRTFQLGEGWARDQLSVAGWLQQDAPSPRFDAREVAQATHAPLGGEVVQAGKGVLVEMLSATWCDPCLYGDRAVEQLAIDRGVAEPASAVPELRYLDLRPRDVAAIALAALVGLAVVLLARRSA